MTSKRITTLEESPCYQCGCRVACGEKIRRSPALGEIRDGMFGHAEKEYHDCGIWIALNTKEIVEVNE